MTRLGTVLLATLTLGLTSLVLHTRTLTRSHLEVAHLFEHAEHGGVAAAAGGASPPPRLGFLEERSAEADARALCDAAPGTPHAELWGDVVVAGAGGGAAGGHSAASAFACCAACATQRGCNVWVWCSAPAACATQCWLKRVGDPAAVAPHAAGDGVPWTSGALPKDADIKPGTLPPPDESIAGIALVTPKGSIRLRLRPEWSPSSVAIVRLLAAHPLETPACEFYRVEPGFLLQGSLRALIPANNVTTPGPRPMRRGEVGWAGGSAGPDFFIYLGAEPATHWGTDHTVWAEVADKASLARADEFAALPPLPTKPGEMHMIASRLPIDVRRDDTVTAVA